MPLKIGGCPAHCYDRLHEERRLKLKSETITDSPSLMCWVPRDSGWTSSSQRRDNERRGGKGLLQNLESRKHRSNLQGAYPYLFLLEHIFLHFKRALVLNLSCVTGAKRRIFVYSDMLTSITNEILDEFDDDKSIAYKLYLRKKWGEPQMYVHRFRNWAWS